MSKHEHAMGTEDVFSIYHENTNKLFTGVKRSVPQYHQSFTNVQQEYLQTVENIVDSTITIQKEYAEKAGISTSIPETTQKIFHNMIEEFVTINSIQNQIILATIDATQQSIRTFNDNAKLFSDLNQNIIKSLTSVLTTKNN